MAVADQLRFMEDLPQEAMKELGFRAAKSTNHKPGQSFPGVPHGLSDEETNSMLMIAFHEGQWSIVPVLHQLKNQSPQTIKELLLEHIDLAPKDVARCFGESLRSIFSEESERIEIARRLAESAPDELRSNIQNFGIRDEHTLKDILGSAGLRALAQKEAAA